MSDSLPIDQGVHYTNVPFSNSELERLAKYANKVIDILQPYGCTTYLVHLRPDGKYDWVVSDGTPYSLIPPGLPPIKAEHVTDAVVEIMEQRVGCSTADWGMMGCDPKLIIAEAINLILDHTITFQESPPENPDA